MPKDDSFYEDHTNRLCRWERENELVFSDSEEEDRHEQELQALRDQELRQQWASWELEQERVRRWRLLHPPKPVHSSDDEDDITLGELEDAVVNTDGLDRGSQLELTDRENTRTATVQFLLCSLF
jgi:hypothetical protein